jgi:hypothetical protein
VNILEVVEQVAQEPGPFGQVRRCLVEEGKESFVAGNQPESHRITPFLLIVELNRSDGAGQRFSTLDVTWTWARMCR